MIIKFDDTTLDKLSSDLSLKDNQNFIDSLNTLFSISQQKEHLLLIDLLVIEYLIDNYNEVLDKSSLRELFFLKEQENIGNLALLTSLPYCINVFFDDSIEPTEVNVVPNPYFRYGKMYNLNILTLKNHSFLSNAFVIVSEHTSDVLFYEKIAQKYMDEQYNNHRMCNFHYASGIGGNIGTVIEQCLQNRQKALIICDTDTHAPDQTPESSSTHNIAKQTFLRNRKDTIINFISLEAHEKENLIPVSWLIESSNQSFNTCSRILHLENSEFRDRLLYIDFKDGMRKSDIANETIQSYFEPVFQELNVNLNELNDEDMVFSKTICSNWDTISIAALNSKKINEFPDYLKRNIKKISINFVGWNIGGRIGIA